MGEVVSIPKESSIPIEMITEMMNEWKLKIADSTKESIETALGGIASSSSQRMVDEALSSETESLPHNHKKLIRVSISNY